MPETGRPVAGPSAPSSTRHRGTLPAKERGTAEETEHDQEMCDER